MSAKHPDFPILQQRLRRLDPDWYDSRLRIDDEWGPGMSLGVSEALAELERQRNLPPILPPAVAGAIEEPGAAPVLGLPPGLPGNFSFLFRTPLPPLMVRIALAEFGTLETAGTSDNPKILGWADEVAEAAPSAYNRWAADFYNDDSVPWCGLFMAMVAVRASQGREDRMPPSKYLAAKEWENWGTKVERGQDVVGDVMVLGRAGGGHVTLNVGLEEGGRRFFGLGGNQSDAVTVAPFDYSRVIAIRRPSYSQLPAGARRVVVGSGGVSSRNEA